jgi:hypothetical protein
MREVDLDLGRAAIVREARVPAPEELARSLLWTAVRTWSKSWAPVGDQRICGFLAIRLATIWFTADSARAEEIASPQRCRSA